MQRRSKLRSLVVGVFFCAGAGCMGATPTELFEDMAPTSEPETTDRTTTVTPDASVGTSASPEAGTATTVAPAPPGHDKDPRPDAGADAARDAGKGKKKKDDDHG